LAIRPKNSQIEPVGNRCRISLAGRIIPSAGDAFGDQSLVFFDRTFVASSQESSYRRALEKGKSLQGHYIFSSYFTLDFVLGLTHS